MKQSHNILALVSVLLLFQPGCGTYGFKQDSSNGSIVVKELVKTTRTWDRALLRTYPQGQPEISIRRISIPAGARLELHHHPVINAGVLLSGELTVVTTDGKTLHLKAGDPIVELVNTKHYGINRGTMTAEIIVVYAGIAGTPVTLLNER